MLRSRIKAFTTLLELIAQVLLKGRPHVVAVARPSYASTVVLHAGSTFIADTDVLFNMTSISVATINETSSVDSAISAILSAGAPPSHLVPVTFTAGSVSDENDSNPTPDAVFDDQEVVNAPYNIDLELPLDSISDASVSAHESKPFFQPLALLVSLLGLLAKSILASTSLSRGFLILRSRNSAKAIYYLRSFVGVLMIDRAFCSQEQAVMRMIMKAKSRIHLLAFMAMCEARASFKTMFSAISHIVTLLPYLVLDKQTLRKLVKLVKTIRLVLLELRARRSATSNTHIMERHVSLDLDDDIIIPPSDAASATPMMMRWSHFGRASSVPAPIKARPPSLSLPVVKKEREVRTDGHFDMATLIEIYACRSTHFSHFGSMNKVPILDTSALSSLDIEIDTFDHDSSPRGRISHFGLTFSQYSAEASDAKDTLRHDESHDPMFAVSSRLPGLYPDSRSCSGGSGFWFFYALFCDIKCELVALLLSIGSWIVVTVPDHQVAESQVESDHSVEVLDPVSPVASETGKLVDAHVPLVSTPRLKVKPSMPSEPDVFMDDIGSSSNRSEASLIAFGIPPDVYDMYGGYEFRPPEPSTLDTPTRWTSSAPPRSPTLRRWEGRRRGGFDEEDNEDFSVLPLSVWDYPYYPLTPRSERIRQ